MNPTVFKIMVGCAFVAVILWCWFLETDHTPPTIPGNETMPPE